MVEETQVYHAELMDEANGYYSLRELCQVCHVHAEYVVEMVEHGLVEPQGQSVHDWRFPEAALKRSQKALRMQKDLNLDLAGVSMALDLLDEIARLKRELRQARAHLPDENIGHEEDIDERF